MLERCSRKQRNQLLDLEKGGSLKTIKLEWQSQQLEERLMRWFLESVVDSSVEKT